MGECGPCPSLSTTRPISNIVHHQVANQRKKYKDWNQKKTASDEKSKEIMRRFDQLEKIGFVFQLGRGKAKRY